MHEPQGARQEVQRPVHAAHHHGRAHALRAQRPPRQDLPASAGRPWRPFDQLRTRRCRRGRELAQHWVHPPFGSSVTSARVTVMGITGWVARVGPAPLGEPDSTAGHSFSASSGPRGGKRKRALGTCHRGPTRRAHHSAGPPVAASPDRPDSSCSGKGPPLLSARVLSLTEAEWSLP